MEIIFTVTNDLSTDQRMIRICTTLQKAGFNVLLVGRQRTTSLPLTTQLFSQHRIKCWFDKGAAFYAEYNLRLLFFLWRSRAQIIGAVDADTLLAGALVAKWSTKKLVFDAHEYFTEVPELIGRNRVRKIWQWILTYGIKHAHWCYTVGPGLAALFSKQYQKAFDVVYNMPVKKEVSVSNTTTDYRLLYQGDVNEGRGLEELIAAIRELPVTLTVAGDGPLLADIKQQVHNHHQQQQVTFLGKVSPDKLHELTQQAWMGVNLLDGKSLSYQYSLANKFFDYVQAHVPVLCANFVEYQTLNQQHEVAVLADLDSVQLKNHLIHLINHPSSYQKLRDNCKLAALYWNWETQEPRLVSGYKQLMHA